MGGFLHVKVPRPSRQKGWFLKQPGLETPKGTLEALRVAKPAERKWLETSKIRVRCSLEQNQGEKQKQGGIQRDQGNCRALLGVAENPYEQIRIREVIEGTGSAQGVVCFLPLQKFPCGLEDHFR